MEKLGREQEVEAVWEGGEVGDFLNFILCTLLNYVGKFKAIIMY